MIRNAFLAGASVAAFSVLVSASAADAGVTTIDFSAYVQGSPITTIGNATFSLQGGPGSGVPVTGSFGTYAVGNSPTGNYPTSAILDVVFAQPVKDVTFTFDNFGDNGPFGAPSYVTSFDVHGVQLGATNLGFEPFGSSFAPGSVAGTGIKDVQFSNGSGGAYSWEFGVGQISFTAVPEPSTWTMLLSGFGFIGYLLRRRVLGAPRAA